MYSIVLTAAAVRGFADAFSLSSVRAKSNAAYSVLFLCMLMSVALLVSVFLERKFLPNHFVRLYVPLSIAAGYGIVVVFRTVTDRLRKLPKKLAILASITVVFFVVIFSPASRIGNALYPVLQYSFDREGYYKFVNRFMEPGFEIGPSNPIISYLATHRSAEQKLYIAGMNAAQLYVRAGEPVWSRLASSQFYQSRFTSEEWKNVFREECMQADWVLLLRRDRYADVNGTAASTEELVKADPVLAVYFDQSLQSVLSLDDAILFQKK
jgi:hypothetical protein